MSTGFLIQSFFEGGIILLIILGFIFEKHVVLFERRLFRLCKKYLKRFLRFILPDNKKQSNVKSKIIFIPFR